MRRTHWRFENFAQSISKMRYYYALFFFLALLSSCKSLELSENLKPFPPDDHTTSRRWLQIGYASFSSTYRCVITDKEFVEESYERANSGRLRGRHLLKEQTQLQLSSENAHWFWHYVDRAKVFDWTDANMPAETHQPSLSYRQGSKEIKLPVSEGCCATESSDFHKLNDQIDELKRRAQSDVVSNGPRVDR